MKTSKRRINHRGENVQRLQHCYLEILPNGDTVTVQEPTDDTIGWFRRMTNNPDLQLEDFVFKKVSNWHKYLENHV